ncbi:ATP-binding cassette domain-containing protein [Microbacteriaceae bacterium 4G12]
MSRVQGAAPLVEGSPLVEVSGLRVHDGDRELVSAVDLRVEPGDRVGIIGESGSGKSLTALSMLGLLPHPLRASGTVLVGGTDMIAGAGRAGDRVRGSTVTAVFQEPLTSLDPLMSVGRQIAWPLTRHRGLRGRELRTAVLDALSDVRLPDPERVARSYIHEISGGQRQRVAIAIALACRPRVLLADEPTTALDVTVQAGILDLLDTAVRERGMALVLISHDLAVVSRITDRVLVMRNGRGIEQGPVARILTAPAEPYTAQLVASARALEAHLPAAPAGGAFGGPYGEEPA